MKRSTLYPMILLTLFTTSAWAVVTSDEAGSHVTTPGQPAFGVDVDGVALLAGDVPDSQAIGDLLGPFCSGALISDRHILTAAHCYDSDHDGTVDAQYGFPSVAVFELPDRIEMLNINSGDDGWGVPTIHFTPQWPATTDDLAVIELKEDAPADIPRYRLNGRSNELGKPMVLAGYGEPGYGATGEDDTLDPWPTKRAGRNRYEDDQGLDTDMGYLGNHLFYDFDSGLEANNSLALMGVDSDLGFGADEVILGFGDSGAPTFIDGVIAGVSAFGLQPPSGDATEAADASWGEAAADVRVSRFRDFLRSATGGMAVFVPEPATLTLSLIALAILVLLGHSCHDFLDGIRLSSPGESAFCSQFVASTVSTRRSP